MDKLCDFVRNNRGLFDDGPLNGGHEARFRRKLDRIGRRSHSPAVRWALAAGAAAVVFFGAMLCRDGLRENPVQAEIDLYNRSLEALTRDIVDVSERRGEDTSEMKTIIRDISNDTVPLYEQLPDELGDEKKARILKKYFNLKLKAVRQLRAQLSDADE